MIAGALHQSDVRRFLSQVPAFARALDWIDRHSQNASDGIVELDGSELCVNVHRYDTKLREACRWESHRQTADLQLCLAGGELIDWSLERTPMPLGPYDGTRDTQLWSPDTRISETMALTPGRFAIFLPGELHRPAIANGSDPITHKLVVKIAASRLRLA